MPQGSTRDYLSRRVYHLSHCIMRMKHRYSLTMDAQDYDSFCKQFKKGEVQGARTDDKGRVEGWLQFKGAWVCMSYIPALNLVGTIMPSPPPLVLEETAQRAAKAAAKALKDSPKPLEGPEWLKDEKKFNQLVAERAKKMAYTLFNQAMSRGKMPKWLSFVAEGAPISAKKQRRAEALVEHKQSTRLGMDPEVKKADIAWFKNKMNDARYLLKTGRFLDAAKLLDAVASLDKTTRPSMNPEEIERVLQHRIAQESDWWTKHFESNGFPQTIEHT